VIKNKTGNNKNQLNDM